MDMQTMSSLLLHLISCVIVRLGQGLIAGGMMLAFVLEKISATPESSG